VTSARSLFLLIYGFCYVCCMHNIMSAFCLTFTTCDYLIAFPHSWNLWTTTAYKNNPGKYELDTLLLHKTANKIKLYSAELKENLTFLQQRHSLCRSHWKYQKRIRWLSCINNHGNTNQWGCVDHDKNITC